MAAAGCPSSRRVAESAPAADVGAAAAPHPEGGNPLPSGPSIDASAGGTGTRAPGAKGQPSPPGQETSAQARAARPEPHAQPATAIAGRAVTGAQPADARPANGTTAAPKAAAAPKTAERGSGGTAGTTPSPQPRVATGTGPSPRTPVATGTRPSSQDPVAEEQSDAGAREQAAGTREEEPAAPTKISDDQLAETAQSKGRGDAGMPPPRREVSTEGVSPEPERPASTGRIARGELAVERASPIPGERLPIPGAEIGIPSARVRKFVDSGGATLDGRLVDIDTGNAIANADIEAWMGTRSVEAQSDAEGHFKIEGLVPGSRIMLWITAAPTFVQERTEVAVPPQRPDFQGTFRMLNRTAVTGTVDGGAGLFLTRRGSRTVVTGLAAFGPAERGGVRVGDSIVSVGKRKVGDLGPGAIDYLLRGPIGSQVEISVQTDSNPPRKIMLQRSAR